MAKKKKRSPTGKARKKTSKRKVLSPALMQEKKKYLMSAGKEAIARAGTLMPEDIGSTRTEARRLSSALVGGRGRGGGLGIVFADMDPTDSIRIVDTDPVDGLARIDSDPRDPLPPGW
jgi:hypothetical protein